MDEFINEQMKVYELITFSNYISLGFLSVFCDRVMLYFIL